MTSGRHQFLVGAQPLAIAHRGGAGEATENSPATFQRVVELGFGWIETDVRATIDGRAVVIHDATLDRTTDASGELSGLPWAHVRGAQLADGEHPITLVDALRRWPAVRFNVDVKSDDTVGPFLAAVAEMDAWGRVCAAAFSTRRLRRLRQLAGPRLATSMGPLEVAGLVAGAPGRRPSACAVQVPVSAGPIPVVTRSFVKRAHSRGLAVHVWTIDDATQMVELLELGVDGLITDHPSLLRDVLRRRGVWR